MGGRGPAVRWSRCLGVVLVLVAARVAVALHFQTRRSHRVLWLGALAGLAIATIGATDSPGVPWSPYLWLVLVLIAATAYVAFRLRTRRTRRLLVAGALAGLTIATIGAAEYAVNFPLDDPSFFCQSPDPSPPSSIVADTIVQECAAGKTVTVSRGQTVAVALEAEWNVDTGTKWTDVSVANSGVLHDVNAPIRVAGQSVSNRYFVVAVYRANQPGDTTIDAVEHFCNAILKCDRGARWWVTIEVT